jgi:hypothetical protein
MTEQQKLVLHLASTLGVDPREIDRAVALARTGRINLLVAVTAQRVTVRAALKAARSNTNPPRIFQSQAR